jgi:hypothetical protein
MKSFVLTLEGRLKVVSGPFSSLPWKLDQVIATGETPHEAALDVMRGIKEFLPLDFTLIKVFEVSEKPILEIK